jgi:hypothetical protein
MTFQPLRQAAKNQRRRKILNQPSFSASIGREGAGQIQAGWEIALWCRRRASAALVSSMAACIAVKRKIRKAACALPDKSELPPWLEDKPSVPYQRYTKASLDDLAANIERGIKDLPVWKDYVRRFGLKEARNILRRGLVLNQITDGSPQN